MVVIGAVIGLLAAAGGVWSLRIAWRRRGGAAWIVGGWLVLAGAVLAWRLTDAAADKAIAFALLVPSLAALVVIGARAEWPETRTKPISDRSGAAAPPETGASVWRGVARFALAGPAGVAAGVGLAAAVGLHLPTAPAVRVMAAGLLLPIVWAGALIWATTDDHLGRVAVGLCGLSVLGFTAAWL